MRIDINNTRTGFKYADILSRLFNISAIGTNLAKFFKISTFWKAYPRFMKDPAAAAAAAEPKGD